MTDGPTPIESRDQQLFPVFTGPEILRLRRFGILRDFPAGAVVAKADDPANGFLFVLSGTLAITLRGVSGDTRQIATYGPGAFVAELAKLSRNQSSVSACALEPLSVLMVSLTSFAAMAAADLGLGDRILRTLILRIAGLTEVGEIGVIVIGARSSQDSMRIESRLTGLGHAYRTIDPDGDPAVRSLIERLRIGGAELPMVVGPSGQLLRNPTDHELSTAAGWQA